MKKKNDSIFNLLNKYVRPCIIRTPQKKLKKDLIICYTNYKQLNIRTWGKKIRQFNRKSPIIRVSEALFWICLFKECPTPRQMTAIDVYIYTEKFRSLMTKREP